MSELDLVLFFISATVNAVLLFTLPRRIAAETVLAQASFAPPGPAKVLRPVFRAVPRGPDRAS